jgi:23S rRNA pseudouridine2604 synthase
MPEERLNKYLASCGYSRREADRLIQEGRVAVNGVRAALGMKVSAEVSVTVDGKPVTRELETRTIALHKPYGYITTSDEQSKDNVMSLVPSSPRLFPVGRLDVRSTGLLLLTSDGTLADRLTHPKYGHEKEYLVGVERPVTDDELTKLAAGVELEDGPTREAEVRRVAPQVFLITLKEGRNRQVRRMCEVIGHKVKTLKRTRFGRIKLGALEPGEWRDLTPKELELLQDEREPKGRRK